MSDNEQRQSGGNTGKDALKDQIIRALRDVHDPEIPVNVYDLGLIYDIDIRDDSCVHVRMTLTTPNCPMAEIIPGQVESKVKSVEGVESASVELVWEPQWNTEMMSEAAKLELEFTGHTTPEHLRKGPLTSLSVGRTGRRSGRSGRP